MHARLEAALGELVFGAPIDPNDDAAVLAFCARHGLSEADTRALREGELARLLVYRELVRGTFRSALERVLPRTLARLGTRGAEYVDAFLAASGSSSHYLRDVPLEFLAFCEQRWPADPDVPGYLIDLARHEALHLEIASAARPSVVPSSAALELDAPVVFHGAARLVVYAHAVHELPAALDDRREPEARPTSLFVYRSPEHAVRYLAPSPLAATLLAQLLGGATLRRAIETAAAEHGAALDAGLIEATAGLLAELSGRGVLLGVAPSSVSSPAERASRA